ncbi:MAG: GntR family transcriptional regulator [Cellulosilyticaceae bacterium]
MPWEFDNNQPIYIQLVNRIKLRIVSGEYELGAKLNSVRDLAEEAGVNPNTMQRALAELEREDLVYSQRTSGRFVTSERERVEAVRGEYAKDLVKQFGESLVKLGYTTEEIIALVEKQLGERV